MVEFKLSFENLYPNEEGRKDNISNSLSSRGTNSIKSDVSLSYNENPLASSITSRNSRTSNSNKSLFMDDRKSISSRGTATSPRLMFGFDQRSQLAAVDEGREAISGRDMDDVDISRFSIYNNIDKFSTATSNILRKKFLRPRKPYMLTNLSTGESYTRTNLNDESLTISRLQVHANDSLPSSSSSSVIKSSIQQPSSSSSSSSSSLSSTKKSSPLSLQLPNATLSSSKSSQNVALMSPLNKQQRQQQQVQSLKTIKPKERDSLPAQLHHIGNDHVKNKHSSVSSVDAQSPIPKKIKIINGSNKMKPTPVVDPVFSDWTWSHEWR